MVLKVFKGNNSQENLLNIIYNITTHQNKMCTNLESDGFNKKNTSSSLRKELYELFIQKNYTYNPIKQKIESVKQKFIINVCKRAHMSKNITV